MAPLKCLVGVVVLIKKILELVDQHLCMLERKLHHYFELTKTKEFDWVRNPFTSSLDHMAFDLSVEEMKELLYLEIDRTLEVEFKDVPLSQFWVTAKKVSIHRRKSYKRYFTICYNKVDKVFSSMLTINNLKRSSLKNLDHEFLVARSTIYKKDYNH